MEVLLKGNPVELVGTPPKVGEEAPLFSLKDLSDNVISLEELKGKPVIISVVPDIDTSVCALQTKHFNKEAATIKDVYFLTISNNTKEQLANWCAAESVDMTMLRDEEGVVGKEYGILIPSINRLARSIFVLDKDGVITYEEIVPEVSSEPNYVKALDAAKALI